MNKPTEPNHSAFGIPSNQEYSQCFGLTKREYFSAGVMFALVASSQESLDFDEDDYANLAVKCANALIAALNLSDEE